jgi:hypothetical protein
VSTLTGAKSEQGRGGLLSRIEHNWIEIAAAALLALATIMSALSAYQASRWSGIESEHYHKSNSTLIESTQLADSANQEISIDIEMLSNYLNAVAQGNTALAQVYETDTFSKELTAALAAWRAAKAANKPDLPRTPIGMPEYKNKDMEKSQALKSDANKEAGLARSAIHHSNTYILLTVLFASVLFFAGISTKFNGKGVKVAMLGMGTVIFVLVVVFVAMQP